MGEIDELNLKNGPLHLECSYYMKTGIRVWYSDFYSLPNPVFSNYLKVREYLTIKMLEMHTFWEANFIFLHKMLRIYLSGSISELLKEHFWSRGGGWEPLS